MHVRIWKFRPPSGREAEFAAVYGPDGPWVRLFSQAAGYRGTSLLRPADTSGWWLTLDRWESPDAFERFQTELRDEYHALDVKLEGLAGEEVFVGAFDDRE